MVCGSFSTAAVPPVFIGQFDTDQDLRSFAVAQGTGVEAPAFRRLPQTLACCEEPYVLYFSAQLTGGTQSGVAKGVRLRYELEGGTPGSKTYDLRLGACTGTDGSPECSAARQRWEDLAGG